MKSVINPGILPKVSIITVTYNAAKVFEPTLESVSKINYPNLEYIVVDGGSKDSTVQVLEKYPRLVNQFISEPDKGVFDAMNKGIRMATGTWLIFLNAGDLIFDPEIFSKLSLEKNASQALVYGNTYDIGIGIRKPFRLNSLDYGMIMACHQSMLFNKTVLQDDLYYDDSYQFYNDYELVVRIFKKFTIKYIDEVIACYLGGGISSQVSWRARYDKYRMMFNLFGPKGILMAVMLKAGYKPF